MASTFMRSSSSAGIEYTFQSSTHQSSTQVPGLGILVQFILLRIYQIYREGQI